MNTELYPAARRALRRVYLLTGAGDGIVERTRRAAALMRRRGGCAFGCVAIPERHTKKGNEDENMLRKVRRCLMSWGELRALLLTPLLY
jgi:hypothetical protein